MRVQRLAMLLVSAVGLGLGGSTARAEGPKGAGDEQVWQGTLSATAGIELRLVLHVRKDETGQDVATFDSPDQGATGLKVDAVTIDKTTLVFEMKAIGAKFEGKLDDRGTEAVGHWSQGGVPLPLTLKKGDKVAEVRRPQIPKPPFPYKVEEVSFANEPGKVTLAGTLTLPRGAGPFPAVVLISGSGAQDRDESLLGHKPFLVLADTLTRRGVAVLRVDDRGVGGSTGDNSRATSEDFAGDVLSGVEFLKARPEVAQEKIGLIGHSEGGIIAPMVAARTDDVAFIVLMAGPGLPGDQILRLQARRILQAMGMEEKSLDDRLGFQRRLLEVIQSEVNAKDSETKIQEIMKEVKAALTDDERKKAGDVDKLLEAQVKMLRSPWFRYFLSYDPRPMLAKVRCPVLALIGEKDLQVPPRENLVEIETALKKAGNMRVTVRELPGLNHLFQTCNTGAPAEYARIEETIAPAALTLIGDWILEQVGKP